ncbi:MAG: hypothetical protein M5U27_11660 [Gaiella sp.]|nr:hypothetical protein [Gaiella sp.]
MLERLEAARSFAKLGDEARVALLAVVTFSAVDGHLARLTPPTALRRTTLATVCCMGTS